MKEWFWYAYGKKIVSNYLELINWHILEKLNEQITHLK